MNVLFLLLLLLGSTLFASCRSAQDENRLTDLEKAKVLRVQNPFGANRVEVPGAKGVFLGLKDCEVYRSISEDNVIVGWEKALGKPFYPLGVCSRSEINANGEYANAFLCVLGMGAGGGCSAGGNYRTKDGKNWEKEGKGKWVKEE
ncbi:MAG: hypothetical protein U1F57_10420 [bacterium]